MPSVVDQNRLKQIVPSVLQNTTECINKENIIPIFNSLTDKSTGTQLSKTPNEFCDVNLEYTKESMVEKIFKINEIPTQDEYGDDNSECTNTNQISVDITENIQGNVNNIYKRNGKHEREMLSKINNEPNKQVLYVITNNKSVLNRQPK